MPDTPDKNLEQQLRDYAQQRRDAAGTPAMHPATRQMLQAEVKQQLGTGAPVNAPRAGGWLPFWPRLAFALGVIVILGVLAILLVPPAGKPATTVTFAKADALMEVQPATREPAAAPVFNNAPTPAPSVIPVADSAANRTAVPVAAKSGMPASAVPSPVRREEAVAASAAPRAFKSAKGGTTASSPGSPPAVQQVIGSVTPAETVKAKDIQPNYADQSITAQKEFSAGVQSKSSSGLPGTEAKTLALKAPAQALDSNTATYNYNVAAASQVMNTRADAGQRYRNIVVAENRKAEATLSVLDEFVVSQNGESLTIVDHDGSVYNGFARPADVSRANVSQERSGAMQLVQNANVGGRGGQTFNRQAQADNNFNQIGSQSQNIRLDQNANAINAPAQNLTANYYFRVVGTNRSLNQRVVFSGNILQNGTTLNIYNNAGNNAVGNTLTANVQNVQFGQQQAVGQAMFINNYNASQNYLNAPNNYINGRVQLDNKQASELNALPVNR